MEDIFDLELVALVSKIVSELQNHLGIADKNLAEFIIAQRLDADTLEMFKRKMTGIGGDSFPLSFLESIDRLVQMMHPSMKARVSAAQVEADKQPVAEKAHFSPGLPGQAPGPDYIGDTLADLEALEPKARINKLQTRKRGRSRSRSRDPQQENRRTSRRPAPEMDEAPVLYRIYDGQVTGVKDFGAFVTLHGVRGNLAGLVHVSRLADGRSGLSHSVERGQLVKVKVISIDGARIGLSMKDVDQETGRDLAPPVDFGSGANMQPLGRGGDRHTDHDF